MNARKILIYLSIINDGDWTRIYNDIVGLKQKELNDEMLDAEISKLNCKCLTCLDEDYPIYLKDIYRPPFVLYYYGDIDLITDLKKNVSVVGSRKCTAQGVKITIDLVSAITPKYNIVSGLAKGIDTISHKTCLNKKGKTIAVLGSGIDYCYPEDNKEVYEEIKNGGHLLVSEYPNKVAPDASHFPIRDRLIAAFSNSLLITEAYEFSGTSITANCALSMNRNVMAVPYPANQNSLCNRIIKDGAFLVENGQDVEDIISSKY